MSRTRIESLKIKSKLLQKAKKRAGQPIPLKKAYAIIAKNAGYDSWQSLKIDVELHEKFRPPQASAQWNTWYATYDEALKHFKEHGGYLLPYQKNYFVCDEHYITSLGLMLDDPDLRAVGQNWARPSNQAAWQRLLKKLT